MYSTLESKS